MNEPQASKASLSAIGNPEEPSETESAASHGRIKSRDLFKQHREVEIDHEGKIYRLRLTQMNKLILTA